AQAARVLGLRIPDDGAIRRRDRRVAVEILVYGLPIFHPRVHPPVERVDRLPYLENGGVLMRPTTHTAVRTHDNRIRAQVQDLVAVERDVQGRLPAERPREVHGVEAQLEPAVPQAADVLERGAEP